MFVCPWHFFFYLYPTVRGMSTALLSVNESNDSFFGGKCRSRIGVDTIISHTREWINSRVIESLHSNVRYPTPWGVGRINFFFLWYPFRVPELFYYASLCIFCVVDGIFVFFLNMVLCCCSYVCRSNVLCCAVLCCVVYQWAVIFTALKSESHGGIWWCTPRQYSTECRQVRCNAHQKPAQLQAEGCQYIYQANPMRREN